MLPQIILWIYICMSVAYCQIGGQLENLPCFTVARDQQVSFKGTGISCQEAWQWQQKCNLPVSAKHLPKTCLNTCFMYYVKLT